jgi:ABC-type arginine/histidine transport system permease subunit
MCEISVSQYIVKLWLLFYCFNYTRSRYTSLNPFLMSPWNMAKFGLASSTACIPMTDLDIPPFTHTPF